MSQLQRGGELAVKQKQICRDVDSQTLDSWRPLHEYYLLLLLRDCYTAIYYYALHVIEAGDAVGISKLFIASWAL